MVIKKFFRVLLLIVFTKCSNCNYSESKEFWVDLGQNITLPCNQNSIEPRIEKNQPVMWIKSDRQEGQISRLKILPDGSLSLERVLKSDTGEYMCTLETDNVDVDAIKGNELISNNDEFQIKYNLKVRTPPPLLVNVSVHPSTVLALLLWDVSDTGGYDISYFSAQYRLKNDSLNVWHNILPVHISPTARQIDVYHLIPNSTYSFQIWAVNLLGVGEVTEIDATTNHVPEEIELARHLLKGAEDFDTRIWVAAVGVVMGTLIILSVGTCYILCKDFNFYSFSGKDTDMLELVPNIILNPVFYEHEYQSRIYQLDENYNDPNSVRLMDDFGVHPVQL